MLSGWKSSVDLTSKWSSGVGCIYLMLERFSKGTTVRNFVPSDVVGLLVMGCATWFFRVRLAGLGLGFLFQFHKQTLY